MLGNGELHQHAVDRVIVVEAGDGVEQFLLGGLLGHADCRGLETALFGVLALAADISLRCGVLAYEDYRQMWSAAVLGNVAGHFGGDFLFGGLCQGLAVYIHSADSFTPISERKKKPSEQSAIL